MLKERGLQVRHQKGSGASEQVFKNLKWRGKVRLIQRALMHQVGHEFFGLVVQQWGVDPRLFGHQFGVELIQGGQQLQGNATREPDLNELFVVRVHAHQDPVFDWVMFNTNLMDVHGGGFCRGRANSLMKINLTGAWALEFKSKGLN